MLTSMSIVVFGGGGAVVQWRSSSRARSLSRHVRNTFGRGGFSLRGYLFVEFSVLPVHLDLQSAQSTVPDFDGESFARCAILLLLCCLQPRGCSIGSTECVLDNQYKHDPWKLLRGKIQFFQGKNVDASSANNLTFWRLNIAVEKLMVYLNMHLMAKLLVFLILLYIPYSIGATNAEGQALLELKAGLNQSIDLLGTWDPNLVEPCTSWSHITCNGAGHVTAVHLESMGFSGSLSPRIGDLGFLNILGLQDNHISGNLPAELGNMTNLQNLNLSNNAFTGDIPSSLGQLSYLQYLVLKNNKLKGDIPTSLTKISTLIEVDLSSNDLTGQIPEVLFERPEYNFSGNKLNCGSNLQHPCASTLNSNSGDSKSKVGVLIGSIGGTVVVLTCFIFLLWKCWWLRYRKEVFVDVSGEDDRKISFGQLKRFSWRELQLATDDFSEKNVLGQGGFGKVYKGVLGDNTKVAIKRLTDYHSPGGEAAFLREVEMISVAVHRNLLRLIGFCVASSERLLVYPYMQNLSVAYRLRELKPGEKGLDWPTRKHVAFGTARGLEYLHEHCNPKIIHRDLKAANILLDEDFEAVVGDFGLAKLVDTKKTHVTTQVRGTMGHIAPEYLSTGKSSEKTDVFGYGIMLLELVTGQRAIDFSRLEEEDDVLLLDHVKKLQREKRLDVIVDRNLKQNYDPKEVEAVIQVALLCTQTSPEDRPKMAEVVRMLEGEGLAERWEEWQQLEVTRWQEYTILPRRFQWTEDSTYNQEAIELSAAR